MKEFRSTSAWRTKQIKPINWLFLVLVTIGVWGFAPVGEAAGRQLVHFHLPAAAAHLQPLGSLDRSQRLNLAISLPLRNQTALDNLLREIYDPASPNYHHYLTPEEFTERFGPSIQDYRGGDRRLPERMA